MHFDTEKVLCPRFGKRPPGVLATQLFTPWQFYLKPALRNRIRKVLDN